MSKPVQPGGHPKTKSEGVKSEVREVVGDRYDELANSTCCLSCGGALGKSNPQKGEVCIDLGSGRGTDVFKLAKAVGPTGLACGIDLSDGMLAVAKTTALELSIENVVFVKSEFEKIALIGNSANLIISNCAINHAQDKNAVWREIFRILKPGGRFVVSDIYALNPVARQYCEDAAAIAACWGGAVEKKSYLNAIAQSGFEQVAILEESKPYQKGPIEVASFTIRGQKPEDEAASAVYQKNHI